MSDRKPGKAVIDGVVQYTSVSALQRYMACERSWWFRYVAGIPDPPGKAAELGTQGHERIAHYLNTGEDILDEIENAGRRHIPMPKKFSWKSGQALLVEQKVDGGLTLGSIPVIGAMDFVLEASPDIPTIGDWKFKGNLQYGHTTPEWLASITHPDGIQMNGYAEWYRRNWNANRWDRVRLRHVHFQTKGPKASSMTEVVVPLADVERNWDTLSEQYEPRIKRTAQQSGPKQVTPNLGHCFKYHKPCVYYAQCQSGGAAARAYAFGRPKEPTEANVSMLSQLKAFSSNAAPAAALSNPVQAISISDTASLAEIQAAAARLRASPVLNSAPPSPTAQEVATATPPEAPKRGNLIVDESTVPDEVLKAQRARTDIAQNPASREAAPVPGPVEVPPTAQAAVVSPTPKRGRGRPRKATGPTLEELQSKRAEAENRAIETGAPGDLELVAQIDGAILAIQNAEKLKEREAKVKELGFVPPSQELLDAAAYDKAAREEAQAKAAAEAATIGTEGVRLYFTGTPLGVLVRDFGIYAHEVHTALLKDSGGGAIDIRLSDAGGFGKWKPLLSAWARTAALPAPGYYSVPQEEIAETVANALIGRLAPGAVTR